MTLTDKDRSALEKIRIAIDVIRRSTEREMPEYKASDWQFARRVMKAYPGLTMYRIDRLVSLGWIEMQPSDGHGPSIRINPNGGRRTAI